MVASLDLTNYLQVASPPTWIGGHGGRYIHMSHMHETSRCAMVHSHSSVDLLRTAVAASSDSASVYCGLVLDVDRDNSAAVQNQNTVSNCICK